jgi:hypothetical protein
MQKSIMLIFFLFQFLLVKAQTEFSDAGITICEAQFGVSKADERGLAAMDKFLQYLKENMIPWNY